MAPPAIQRPKKRTVAITVVAGLLLLLTAILAIAWAGRDPDRARVENYVREHLDDEYFELVRWWPAVMTTAGNDGTASLLEEQVASMGENKHIGEPLVKRAAELRALPPVRICRIRYRTKRGETKELRDELYKLTHDAPVKYGSGDLHGVFPE